MKHKRNFSIVILLLLILVITFFTIDIFIPTKNQKLQKEDFLVSATPSNPIISSPFKLSTTITIPILTLAYYPLLGDRLDRVNVIADKYGEYPFTLTEVRTRVKKLELGTINALEKGQSVLKYQAIAHIEKLEPVPLSSKSHNGLPLPDYQKMFTEINICHYIDNLKVKEVWLWSYGGVGKSGWESNFASKDGDVSNSDRDKNDLPVCKNNYTVYDYNYGREITEAVHDHMHQFEAIFDSINQEKFWGTFVGLNQEVKGCGNTHLPPNANRDYEYNLHTIVESYCDSWPENSIQRSDKIECNTWKCDQLEYFIWWMQHIPRQWWTYVGQPNEVLSPKAHLD